MIVVSALATTPALADDPRPGTNLDVMSALGEQVVGDALLQLDGRLDKNGVRVTGFAVNEHYQFLNGIFTSVLTQRGYRTYPGTVDLPDGSTLQYELLNFHLSYPEVYRSWLIGGKKVKRRAEIKMTMSLMNPDGSVGWVGESMKTFEDEFSHSDLSRMEEGAYSFTKPTQAGVRLGTLCRTGLRNRYRRRARISVFLKPEQ